MSTLSVVRSRKEIPNPLACLPDCRAVLCLLALPLLAQAWQTATPPVAACQAAGQITGWDLLEHTFTLKSDSSRYSEFHYDGSTTFTAAGATFRPDELGIPEGLNIDDRLCVEAFRADNREIASRVQVTFRAEIDARDKRELVRWQSEALFGTVTLDPQKLEQALATSGLSVPTCSHAECILGKRCDQSCVVARDEKSPRVGIHRSV